MTNWAEKRRKCKRCLGSGYVNSKARHEDGSGRPANAVQCPVCSPQTMVELKDAATQEN